jgi:ribosomal protein L37AE/L43A
MDKVKLNCGRCGIKFSESDISVLEEFERQVTDPLYCDSCAIEMVRERAISNKFRGFMTL